MELLVELISALAVCSAVIAVIILVKSSFLTPVIRRRGTDVFAVIYSAGEAPGLEQTVRGLGWLRDSGQAELCLIIADAGLTPEALLRAEKLAARYRAELVGAKEISKKAEELRWRENR